MGNISSIYDNSSTDLSDSIQTDSQTNVISLNDFVSDKTGGQHPSIYYSDPKRNDRLRSIRKIYSANSLSYESRTPADNELISYAYDSIINSRDYEFDRIERSNFFDEWKDTLQTITLRVENLSSNHRKIIGILLVVTKNKDISDFDDVKLKLFENATFTFKQHRVSKSDSKRIIKEFLDLNMDIIIPMGSFNEDEPKNEFDSRMKMLIERLK
jgi:hypothetical protein